MVKNMVGFYVDKDYKNINENETRLLEDRYKNEKELHKEFEESIKSFLEGTSGLFNKTFMEAEGAGFLMSYKIMDSKIAVYSEAYMANIDESSQIMKSILNDSCALAEGIEKNVSYSSCSGAVFAYCSGHNNG